MRLAAWSMRRMHSECCAGVLSMARLSTAARKLREVGERIGIKEVHEWESVSRAEFVQHGGGAVLLAGEWEEAVAGEEGEREREREGEPGVTLRRNAPHGHWKKEQNCQEFLRACGEVLGAKTREEWATVDAMQLRRLGGDGLLRQGSLFALLDRYLPHDDVAESLDLYRRQVPRDHWREAETRRRFLDLVAKEYEVETTSDWKKVKRKDIVSRGGAGLLALYPSLFAALADSYPEKEWSVFECRKHAPLGYWDQEENIRSFVKLLKEKYRIREKKEWERLSRAQVAAVTHGGTLMKKMKLVEALRIAYPKEQWDEEEFAKTAKRSKQRWLLLQMERLFPSCHMVEEDVRLDELRGTARGGALEVDLFLPELKLALEFNGEHHYHEVPFFGPVEIYRKRDREKAEMCEAHGIRLVTVPYWWDLSLESLAGSLLAADPSLFDSPLARDAEGKRVVDEWDLSQLSPIPEAPPVSDLSVSSSLSDQMPSLAHGDDESVRGMWMAPMVKGRKVHYVGGVARHLASLDGRVLPAASSWLHSLPPDTDLDGSLRAEQ